MSKQLTGKDGPALMRELLELTAAMVERLADADFLVEGVEKRQAIMDAYDEWAALNPDTHATLEQDPCTLKTISEILAMDKAIVGALGGFKAAAQREMTSSKTQQKVMGYLGSATSSSGSYMDVKLK